MMTDTERNEIEELKQQVKKEATEREALQKMVLGPLDKVRTDLDHEVAYFCERFEELRQQRAGGVDAATEEAIALHSEAIVALLKHQTELRSAVSEISCDVAHSVDVQARTLQLLDRLISR